MVLKELWKFNQMSLVILIMKIIFKVKNKFQSFLKLLKKILSWYKTIKAQLHKIQQSWKFLGRFLGPLLKIWLPLIGNVLKPLAKSI